MQLNDALTQIAEIRSQVERTRVYRGYRSVPVAISGVLAVGAAAVQNWFVRTPLDQIHLYVAIWFCAAVLSVLAAGGEIATRYRRTASETMAEGMRRGFPGPHSLSRKPRERFAPTRSTKRAATVARASRRGTRTRGNWPIRCTRAIAGASVKGLS